MCCSVLQCTARVVVCCSVPSICTEHFVTLQHTVTHYNAPQHTAAHYNTLCNTPPHSCWQHTTTHRKTHCHTPQHTATHCNMCSTLQHTTTRVVHCNTLQHARQQPPPLLLAVGTNGRNQNIADKFLRETLVILVLEKRIWRFHDSAGIRGLFCRK